MATIARKFMKIFASTADADQIAVFGSLNAGSPAFTTDPETIQSLSNYLEGWYAGVVGGNSPAIQDMNALQYLFAYQLSYLLQHGVPEWDDGTTYYTNDIVSSSGILYLSLTDTNLNNVVTDTTKWKVFVSRTLTSTFASPTSVGGATAIPSASAQDEDIYVVGNNSTWTARSAAGTIAWNYVMWGSAPGLFVAVGATSVMTSPDGVTWTTRTPAEANTITMVCYSPKLGAFVSVASDGTNRVGYSQNGTSWSTASASEANQWAGVCWSDALELFVAVSSTGTNRVMTSPDGSTWTARSAAEANGWQDVIWNGDLGQLIAVAPDGTNRVMRSNNGANWTTVAAAEANEWRSVCWSKKLKLYCAVASSGTNRVMTSPDGLNWTARSAAEANQWFRVTFSEEWGVFVAVARTGTNRVMTSQDGINWTAVAASEANAWNAVAWSPTAKVFAAISQDGTNRAMSLAPTAITASPKISAATMNGKRLTVIGTSDTATVLLTSLATLPLQQDIYLAKNKSAVFRYDTAQALYIRVNQ